MTFVTSAGFYQEFLCRSMLLFGKMELSRVHILYVEPLKFIDPPRC